ncbi:CaiB/BaiF CoA-transferase family protein [Polaromonas hydrogenivorans]|uniref:CaiB/BaiF CoA-transferase family protein n=1 Tax=Polaromonas hydrogenivorans TaxID=335476 RepID=A0AAU7M234_9BURK
MSGPLKGIKIVHLASLGPGPYAAMLLADLGCDVTIIDRTGPMMVSVPQGQDPRRRSQRSIALDLKQAEARSLAMELIAQADVLIEGMRPGVTERLGLGPADCHQSNPGLIYARVTGWGQSGPLALRAGHDINYIALSGALYAMGEPGSPPPVPLNLLGDYAGGGAFVVMGIMAALIERGRTGRGQVIDGAIVDGVASLTAATLGMKAAGRWGDRGTNLFDGSAPWYRTYRTRDGGYVAVGAIEPQFYDELLRGLGLDPVQWPREDRARWPAIEATFAQLFAAQDRAHWQVVFDETDACVSPVLSFEEAAAHPHHQARGTYISVDGITQPAPAPCMSYDVSVAPGSPPRQGADTDVVLRNLGRSEEDIKRLRTSGAVA